MPVQRLDNVLIVVVDLDTMINFFTEIGLELEGRGPAEGEWVERVIGVEHVEQEIAMLRTPGGGSKVELASFRSPEPIRPDPVDPPANTLGIRRIMFAVDDLDDTVVRLESMGGELVGEVVQFEDVYRLCYVRGPEGILIGLAEEVD